MPPKSTSTVNTRGNVRKRKMKLLGRKGMKHVRRDLYSKLSTSEYLKDTNLILLN